jgi:hypothetical protein
MNKDSNNSASPVWSRHSLRILLAPLFKGYIDREVNYQLDSTPPTHLLSLALASYPTNLSRQHLWSHRAFSHRRFLEMSSVRVLNNLRSMYGAPPTDASETSLSRARRTVRPALSARTSGSRITRRRPRRPTRVRPQNGEILIAVMGVTGSGKSYFCRSATGDNDIMVGDGLESCNATDTPVKYICLLILRYTETNHVPTDVTH